MGERKRHSAVLKAKVAVEAIQGERSLSELAGEIRGRNTQFGEANLRNKYPVPRIPQAKQHTMQ